MIRLANLKTMNCVRDGFCTLPFVALALVVLPVIRPPATDAADPFVPPTGPPPATIRLRLAEQRFKPSVHDDPEVIARGLAAAGVPADTIEGLFAAASQADLPGMAASIDAFLFFTRDPRWLPLRRQFAEFLELPDVVAVDEATMRALADYDGVVTLPQVSELTPESAAACRLFGSGSWGAAVEFPSLTQLTPEVAAGLARCEALLVFPQLVELSVETARALAAHEGVGIVLGGLETLPADVAEALAETQSMRGLLLPDLESLDAPALARRLARQDHVFLPAVTRLSPEIATALRGNEGGELALPALEELPLDVARKIVGAGYYWLTLGSASTLTPEVAAILAEHNGQLTLTGTKPFTAAAAAALVAHEGSIVLPHLPTLPADVARALAPHSGPLVLGGVTQLTAAEAAALAVHSGGVHLPAVETITPEVAAILAPRSGTLDFSSLRHIDAATAAAFAAHAHDVLAIGGLSELSPEVAAALATFKGRLALPALTRLSPEAAAALAPHRGELALESLADLPADVATQLARHAGGLDLNGVERLSPEAAEALAATPGRLSLAGLQVVSPEGAAALAGREEPLFLEALQYVESLDSPAVAELLVKHCDDLSLENLGSLTGPEAVAIARVLVKAREGLALPALERISPRALEVLLARPGVGLPPLEGLKLVPDADGNDDFVDPR